MTKPQTQKLKNETDPFIPDIKILVGVSLTDFSCYWKIDPYATKKMKVTQGFNNLPDCKQDIEDIVKALAYYDVHDDEGKLRLAEPKYAEIVACSNYITNHFCAANPDKNVLIIWAVAGHGMVLGARQAVVLNDIDKRYNFYKLWRIEEHIRLQADRYTNSY